MAQRRTISMIEYRTESFVQVSEQYSCRRLSELCGQILLQEKRYINEQKFYVAVGVRVSWFFFFKPYNFDIFPSEHEVKTS